MKVHVLGHWGAYPEAGEATTGLLVEHEHIRVLIDCGSGVLSQMQQICRVEDLDAVVLTHHHHDHTADVGVFTYALLLARIMGKRQEVLPMYMLDGPSDRMKDLLAEPLAGVHVIDERSVVHVGGLTITFAPTVHPVPCLAVRVVPDNDNARAFVFSADTSWSDELVRLAKGARVLLCESSMYEGQEKEAAQVGHLTAPQAGQTAQQAEVQRLVLTHLPHYGHHDDLVAQARNVFHGEVSLAHTGKLVEV